MSKKIIKISEISYLNYENISNKDIPAKVKYLDTGNITKNRISELQEFDTSTSELPSRAQRKIKKNTIIYSTVRPNLEHFGILENPPDNLIVSTGFTTIDINDPKIDAKYIYYALTQKHYTEHLHRVAVNNVSSYPSINPDDIGNIELTIPEKKDDQQKIASVLSSLDAKIELNNRINAELEAMARTLYDYWFVQFNFPDKNGKPYKSSGGKMVWNEELKREIPEGWEVKRLGDQIILFDSLRIPLSSKERERKRGNIPYYGATEIMDYVDEYLFDGDYLLLAEDGSVMNEKGFPIMQFIWGKTWVNNHAHVIQSKNINQNEFYYQLMSRIPVILIKTGSIQMKINQENLKSHRVLIPTQELINDYSRVSKSIREELKKLYEENKHLSSLRDFLLPMLMNGQVKVV